MFTMYIKKWLCFAFFCCCFFYSCKDKLNAGLVLSFRKVLNILSTVKISFLNSNSALGNQLYRTHTGYGHTA